MLYQMRILDLLEHLNLVELDVEELIDGLEGAANGDIILQFDGDFMVYQRLEEAVRMRQQGRQIGM